MDGEQVAIVEAKNVPETASLETLVNQVCHVYRTVTIEMIAVLS